jgi:hypothetical protein
MPLAFPAAPLGCDNDISFFACCAATTALGWGDEGHRTIGAMDKLIAGTAAATHVHALRAMKPFPPPRSGPIRSKAGGIIKVNMGRQVRENPLHLTPYDYI